METKKRDHARAYDVGEARRGLDSLARAVHKTLGRRVSRLPGGSYGVYLKCLTRDRRGAVKESYRIIGDEHCVAVLQSVADELAEADKQRHKLRLLGLQSQAPDEAYYLAMPAQAEARASKLRKLLKEAWCAHVKGTEWENRRQMFKAVKDGAPPFPWWDSVTGGVPFESVSLDDAAVSKAVYEHVAPRLLNEAQDAFEARRAAEVDEMRRDAPAAMQPLLKLLADAATSRQ